MHLGPKAWEYRRKWGGGYNIDFERFSVKMNEQMFRTSVHMIRLFLIVYYCLLVKVRTW